MLKYSTIFYCVLLSASASLTAQRAPGGVFGSEMWYVVNHYDLGYDIFANWGHEPIKLAQCPGNVIDKAFLNFNDAIGTPHLCLRYTAPLENTLGRSVFFIKTDVFDPPVSHVTTSWSSEINSVPQDSLARNRFDFSDKVALADRLESEFGNPDDVSINFLHYTQYDTDKKFKSFGYKGETDFFIGKEFTNGSYQSMSYRGVFPEYISYPFELSANERHRVESYLGLKYGITLDENQEYLSARNIVFWRQANNALFKNRIFGIGRDDTSSLKQYQSHSSHLPDYLIASVEDLVPTNAEKQTLVNIPNEHFLVFGDNGSDPVLGDANAKGVRPLKRKWLSQRTGSEGHGIPMDIQVDCTGELWATAIANPEYTIWMMHDKFVDNQQESDFNHEYVEYYEPFMNAHLARYEDIRFDADQNVFDQFTFGVGPRLIVQARYEISDCKADTTMVNITISGGVAPYEVLIQLPDNSVHTFITSDQVVPFEAEVGVFHYVKVYDSNLLDAMTTFTPTVPVMNLNLGYDQHLVGDDAQVVLDAGAGIGDPEATYEWYHDGVLLEETGPVLIATMAGIYEVIVVDSERRCTLSDEIQLYRGMKGDVDLFVDCVHGADIQLELQAGTPPFTTIITGGSLPLTYVHNAETYVMEDVPPGSYLLTSTDAYGSVFETDFEVIDPLEGLTLDMEWYLLQMGCQIKNSSNSFPYESFDCPYIVLDASTLVTYPNVGYLWTQNGSEVSVTSQVQVVGGGHPSYDLPHITVKVTNLDTGCYNTDSFYIYKNEIDEVQSIVESLEPESDPEAMAHQMKAWVYPNPSDSGATFNYYVEATADFSGVVTLYSPTGAIIQSVQVQGDSRYVVPFELFSAGLYLIRIQTADQTLATKIVIR